MQTKKVLLLGSIFLLMVFLMSLVSCTKNENTQVVKVTDLGENKEEIIVIDSTKEIIDNCDGVGTITSRVNCSLSNMQNLEVRNGQKVEASGNIDVFGVGVHVGTEVAKEYGSTWGQTVTTGKEIEQVVLPGYKNEFEIEQYQKWRKGEITVTIGSQKPTSIPYKWLVGVGVRQKGSIVSLACPNRSLEVVDAVSLEHRLSCVGGALCLTLLDIKLKNTQNKPVYVKRALLEVIEKVSIDVNFHSCRECHYVKPSAAYLVDLDTLMLSKKKEVNISHPINAGANDRFILALGGKKSFFGKVKVTLIANQDEKYEVGILEFFTLQDGSTPHASRYDDKRIEALTSSQLTNVLDMERRVNELSLRERNMNPFSAPLAPQLDD